MACYLPGTGTLVGIGIFVYLIWHKIISEILHILGLVLETALICATVALAIGIVIWTAQAIQRRRARAGACLNCRLPCQQSLDVSRSHVSQPHVNRSHAASATTRRPILVTLVPSRAAGRGGRAHRPPGARSPGARAPGACAPGACAPGACAPGACAPGAVIVPGLMASITSRCSHCWAVS